MALRSKNTAERERLVSIAFETRHTFLHVHSQCRCLYVTRDMRRAGCRKLPKEAAKRLELLRRSGRQTLEQEMYEVYTDMLKRNEDIGMSEMDLQGPTSFHTKMDTIRPQVQQLLRSNRRFRFGGSGPR